MSQALISLIYNEIDADNKVVEGFELKAFAMLPKFFIHNQYTTNTNITLNMTTTLIIILVRVSNLFKQLFFL